MKFSGKMFLKIILKVTKHQGFSLSLEDTLFEKPQGGSKIDTPPPPHPHPPPAILGLNLDVIQVSEPTICASLLAQQNLSVIRIIPHASFTFTKNLLGKMLLSSGAILHGRVPIFINSSIFSRDNNSSLLYLQ